MSLNREWLERAVMLALLAAITVPLIALAMASSGMATYAPTLGELAASADVSPDANVLAKIEEPDTAAGDTLFTITFTGVCVPGTLFGSSLDGTFNKFAEIGEDFFANLRGILSSDGCTVMPLGCVLATGDYDRVVKTENPAYWIRGESSHAALMAGAGADIVPMFSASLYDYGISGFEATEASIADAGMTPVGEDVIAIPVGDRSLALRFIDVGEADGDALTDYRQAVSADRESSDFVIIAVNGLGKLSRAEAQEISRSMIDAGAMCVVGIDGEADYEKEAYGGGEIFYSLGTLIDGTGLSGGESVLLQLTLRESESGELSVTSHELVCSFDVLDWTPEINGD